MRIGIVNDSAIATEALRRVISGAPAHAVAWTAADGVEAVRRCAENRPDLVLMDLIMPVMDGTEATRRIMAATPCAILIVTADAAASTSRVFEALGAGALDVVNTPRLAGLEGESGAKALLAKIEMLGRLIGPPVPALSSGKGTQVRSAWALSERWLFALGASAGGPAALAEVLKAFPRETPAAFVVVQHLDEHFAPGLADWLGQQINLPVRLAREGDAPQPGVVLLPAKADHLILTASGALTYTAEPTAYAYRPSVDVLFESIVAHWHAAGAGVLLTGMGRDGARGLKKMREAKFATFAQDQASCAVYGMPKAAAELDAAERILPPARIAIELRQLLSPPIRPG